MLCVHIGIMNAEMLLLKYLLDHRHTMNPITITPRVDFFGPVDVAGKC